MGTLNEIKQLAEADTPLLFFECLLPSGDYQYWSTHSISFNGNDYSARVLKHNLFDLQLSSDDAMDGISEISVTLANADSALSQIDTVIGLKGSQLTVYFAFADLPTLTVTTESTVLFRGVAGDPDEIVEDFLNLSFTNKLSLQRIPIPGIRIQRSCPWSFPATLEQRNEASSGGAAGRLSRL
jgi:hypothetical protein